MDPVTGMLIIGAATAMIQSYQAEKAAGASRARLRAIEAEFNKLVPPEYDVSITDPPEYVEQRIPPTAFSPEALTPAQYQVAAKYKPEIAPLIAEKNPELVKQSQASQEGRQAQLDSLRKMRGIASSDQDPELMQRLSQASRQAQIDAQSRSQSIVSDMARRGAGNSGIAAMLQQQASADAMDREAGLGQQAASEAYRNKLQAIREAASMGGDVSSAEDQLAARNADIINSYNQRFTKANQDFQAQRAASMNEAGMFNTRNAQDVANANTDATNRMKVLNTDRNDMIARQTHQDQIGDRDYRNALAEKRANWAQGQKEYGNTLKGQAFQNQLAIAQGKAGIGQMGMNVDQNIAAQRNTAIQGVGQAGMGYMAQKGSAEQATRAQDRADARAQYQRTGEWPSEDDEEDDGLSLSSRRKLPAYASSSGAAYGPNDWRSGS